MISTLTDDDRAVSESLGYVIIFGVIVSCIALVLLSGNQIINDTEKQTSFNGMKQSFDVIGSDLRKAAYGGTTVITTSVKVDSGSLYMKDASSSDMRIEVYDDTNFDHYKYGKDIGAIGYTSDIYGQSIGIENGAVIETYGGNGKTGSIMTSQPRIFYSAATGTLMIDVINLDGASVSQGGGVARIQTKSEDFSTETFTPSSSNVEIRVKTDNPGAWNDYFTNGPKLTVSTADNADPDHWSYAKITGVQKVIIVTYDMSVTF